MVMMVMGEGIKEVLGFLLYAETGINLSRVHLMLTLRTEGNIGMIS